MNKMTKSPYLQPNYVTKPEFDLFRDEMYVFKDEMNEFRDEMYAFKDEMYEFKREMYEFKDEMYKFRSEMYEFKDEMYKFRSEMYDFKDEMYEFRNEVYLRFDDIDEKFVTLRREIGIDMDMKLDRLEMKLTKQMNAHFGAIKEIFSHELAKAVEAMTGIVDFKVAKHEEKYHGVIF